MTHRHESNERINDLLVDFATVGLTAQEEREIQDMLGKDFISEAESYERAAATLDRGFSTDVSEEMPAHLQQRVLADCRAFLAEDAEPAPVATETPVTWASEQAVQSGVVGRIAPWLVAAAAILIAAFAWMQPSGSGTQTDKPITEIVDGALDVQVTPWAENQVGVSGEVHWSPSLQRGYMKLTGLATNDPEAMQYQLWIFDGTRNPKFNAVDGGVFDIAGTGEIIVPIDAKLDVREPALFAITTEPPGGVVKHDPDLDPERFRIILTASPSVS